MTSDSGRGPGEEEGVPASAYTRDYYLSCCGGHDEFATSRGLALPRLIAEFVDRASLGPSSAVLDIGAGRGELVLNAAARGARAVGIDYAPVAIELAREALGHHPDLGSCVSLIAADAGRLPLQSGLFDVVFMLDVVEHLHPDELHRALGEARRVLRREGRLFIHTMPNVRYYRWVYPLLWRLGRLLRESGSPRDPRSVFEHEMHVNEQTPRTLERALRRAGFDASVWVSGVEKWPLPAGRLDVLTRAIGKRRPLVAVAGFHVFAVAAPRLEERRRLAAAP